MENKALKVGMASFLMVAIIAAMLVWKSGIFLRAAGYSLIGDFQNVNGLLKGGEVRYRGYQVGRVSKIMPGPKTIRVIFFVNRDVKIPEGSNLRVVFDGLIGEKYIDIVPNSASETMLETGAVIPGYSTSGLADFVDVGTENLRQTKAILETIRGVLTSTDVAEGTKRIFAKFESITDGLAKLVSIANDPKVQNIAVNMAKFTDDLAAMGDSLKAMSQDAQNKELVQKLDTVLSNLVDISNEMNTALAGTGAKPGEKSKEPGLLSGISSMTKTLASISFGPESTIRYGFATKTPFVDANLDLKYSGDFLRFGFSDRTGNLQFMNLQQGVAFSNNVAGRFGMFYNKAGAGLDYKLNRLKLSLDVFNPQAVELDAIGRLSLDKNIDLAVGLGKDPNSSSYSNYSVGLTFHP